MGIFGALTTAVAGLRSQSYALENISGNIANSQTTGFKRVDTSFTDLIPDAPANRQTAGGVQAWSRATNSVQGDIQNSSSDTHMAINGDGYFVVQKASSYSDGQPNFSGVDVYTRRGDFTLDKDGYLINGAGYYLKALPVDATTGNVSGSVPQVIQFNSDFLPAEATTQIDYRANLSTYPKTSNADEATPFSELLDPTSFGTNPITSGTVTASDSASFLSNSIAGGAITSYDANGAPVNVQFRWVKTDAARYASQTLPSGAASTGTDTWHMFYMSNSNATGAQVAWTRVPQTYTFNSNGQLSPAVNTVSVPSLTVNGVNVGTVTLAHNTSGLTQFANSDGSVQVTQIKQDGFPAGEMLDIAVSDRGRIVASYSNGRSAELAEIPVVSFYADDALKRVDGGVFEQTQESGTPIIGATGSIIGKALEGSNTDISDEFTKLIVTQQAYAANTRVVSTSDKMLQEVLNMVR